MKFTTLIFIILLISGCTISNIDKNFSQILLDDNSSVAIKIDKEWWLEYNENYLNDLIKTALQNNTDLKKSAISINKALAQAGVISSELIPTFNANTKAQTSKDISTNSDWNKNYTSGFSLSYELDLWKKMTNSKDALMWEVNATKYDMEATKLSLINSIISSYFNAIYLKNSLKLYNENLQNYKIIKNITISKVKLGKDEQISLNQIDSQILNIQNKITLTQKSLDTLEQTIRNLLNVKPDFNFNFKDEFDIAPLGVSIDVPLFALSNRPDLQASIARINKALLNVNVSQKSFYPNVSIGASLTASSEKFADSFSFKLLGGNILINLPFLNYSKLKSNLKISEAEFESAKIEYIQKLTAALNEIDKFYKELQNDEILLNNYTQQVKNYSQIAQIYMLKYNFEKVELKEYLNAKNNQIDANISELEQKYNIVNDEIKIFKSMAGRVK